MKLSLLAAFALLPLAAQQLPPQPEPGITRQQADEILKELRQIRQLLEKQAGGAVQPEPSRPKISDLSGVPMLGSKEAPITIVEYTDYQCPFCQRFHTTSFTELKKAYIDTGKARFYSKDLPLDFHPNAMRAAEAARCAGDQGKFWELREAMSSNPDRLDMGHIMAFASDLKLDTLKFQDCVTSEKYKESVQADSLEAMRIGATGTPSFVVGKSSGAGVEGELMIGAMPFYQFELKLKQLQDSK
jgi:protein-disulfide isomerase